MRRFLLFMFVSCTAASVAFSLWPRQLDGYLALFERRTMVNSGVAVTVLALLTLSLVALRVRLWRSQRELARARQGLVPAQPAVLPYPSLAWGPRPVR
jgi:hypothetical protein